MKAMKPVQAKRLLSVLRAVEDRDAAELAVLTGRIAHLETQVSELMAPFASSDATAEFDGGLTAAQHMAWRKKKADHLRYQIWQLEQAAEAQREVLRNSFGRHQATQMMTEKMKAAFKRPDEEGQ